MLDRNDYYVTEPQDVECYSTAQMSLAAFLGLPIANAIPIGKNARSMGNRKAARQSVALGALGTVIVLTMACLLPGFTSILPIANVLGVQQWYKQTQEAAFRDHIAQGGERGPWAVPIGLGMLVLILMGAIIYFGIVMLVVLGWSKGDG